VGQFVEIRVLSVNCANMETSSAEYDQFALSGAVMVDGKTHPFAFPTVALKTGWSWPYNEVLFSGWVEGDSVSIGAIGMDIDDSDGWAKTEADVRKVVEVIAKAASKLPVPYIGDVIGKIPDVIDFFTGLDDDDEVFRCAETVTLEVLGGGVTRTKTIEPRTRNSRMAGPITISDWNYSLTFAVTWTGQYDDFEDGPEIRETTRPHRDSVSSEWAGTWRSADREVACRISPSVRDLQWVDIESEVRGVITRTEGAAISQVSIELLPGESVSGIDDLAERMRRQHPIVAVTKPREHGTVIERLDPVVNRNWRRNLLEKTKLPTKPVVSPVGGGRVQLADGHVLEIHEALQNGEPDGFVLHYIGPAQVTDVIFPPAATDVVLTRPHDIT